MNGKIIIIVAIAAGIIPALIVLSLTNNGEVPGSDKELTIAPVNLAYRSGGEKINLANASQVFDVFAYSNDFEMMQGNKPLYHYLHFALKPDMAKTYDDIGIKNDVQNAVFVIPIFTLSAYWEPAFYTYYRGECDQSCLTVPIRYNHPPTSHIGDTSIKVLRLLGYPYITDIEIDRDPDILKQFDKVILLHNEYVTQKEFDAITSHPNVVYLYPNALYAKINVNYGDATISLVRGHNYPEPEIRNGFEWEHDNSPFEYDIQCKTWEFYEINNGNMLNCYPENIVFKDKNLLQKIKDF